MENWNMAALLAASGFNLAVGAWNLVAAIRHDRKAARLDQDAYEAFRKHHADDDLACAQEEADRLGLTPLNVDYPTDTGLGVEPGAWRVTWPAAKQRIERERIERAMVTGA